MFDDSNPPKVIKRGGRYVETPLSGSLDPFWVITVLGAGLLVGLAVRSYLGTW